MTSVLVDTSVWVDHFRHRNGALVELIEWDPAPTHPTVLGELACGTPPAPRARTLDDIGLLPACAPDQHSKNNDVHRTRKTLWIGLRSGRHDAGGFGTDDAWCAALDAGSAAHGCVDAVWRELSAASALMEFSSWRRCEAGIQIPRPASNMTSFRRKSCRKMMSMRTSSIVTDSMSAPDSSSDTTSIGSEVAASNQTR